VARADDQKDWDQVHKLVPDTIKSFKNKDSTLTNFFGKSEGYAVFPRIGKGGFIFGGASGKGEVFEKGKLIGRVTLSQGTFGLQVGGQVFTEVIFFESKDSMDRFKQGNFTLAAQVGAVAAAEGVGQTAKYENGVAIFTMVQSGLMAEATVGGQKFDFIPSEPEKDKK
jgi:lipid-binding SYLF domain-containing protein